MKSFDPRYGPNDKNAEGAVRREAARSLVGHQASTATKWPAQRGASARAQRSGTEHAGQAIGAVFLHACGVASHRDPASPSGVRGDCRHLYHREVAGQDTNYATSPWKFAKRSSVNRCLHACELR